VSQFAFLEAEFADLHTSATRAEAYALDDPVSCMLNARIGLEGAVKWAFRHDANLVQPYEPKLNAFLNEPSFKALADGRVHPLAKKIQRAGNKAAHESKQPTKVEAVEVVSALWQFCLWFAHTYARGTKPDVTARFNPHGLLAKKDSTATTLKERKELEAQLVEERELVEATRTRLEQETRSKEQLEAELAAARAEVAEAKKTAAATPIPEGTWSEAETRKWKIDALLAEAGWMLTNKQDREYQVTGMPSESGIGYVDYVLWGDDGKPLAVVEAKRAMASIAAGTQQARLYADCLEAQFGQRPVMYLSSGYDHRVWDDQTGPHRSVQGFHSKEELALMVRRRTIARPLSSLDINADIAGRYYQERAIRSIAESFETNGKRKALVVMATGAGKTRTVIALVDLLMRANLVKRVLFLADRTALVNQAVNAFKEHLPDSSPVNLVTEKNELGRVYASTYQTMVGLLAPKGDAPPTFGIGHFDLVVIDEAHRSVYKKYRSIFEYFDSLLVGLTATPKDEVSHNTYELFDEETGVPTDAYSLEEAIADKWLVPPEALSVPLKFQREGIRYNDLSEEERENWDELDWDDDDLDPPTDVGATDVNKWLFNTDTVDKVLAKLMTDGIHVAGGDRLGKTMIFAKNQKHAEFIHERFITHYPKLDNGNFARIITNQTKYAQSVIDDFSQKDKAPHIAISVDMLDTGIDVPECVNLVFFKLVRSKTKFWQMLGRGTRLCPDLFGPDDDKTHFLVHDYCQNLEYFSQQMAGAPGVDTPSLSERLFLRRVEVLGALDHSGHHAPERSELAELLRDEVASMNPNNFIVRPHLQAVERFAEPAGWTADSLGDPRGLLNIAGLPREGAEDKEQSKRFDLIMLRAELSVLASEPFVDVQERIIKIAALLESIGTGVPAVAAEMELILAVQTEDWWTDVTYPMLESTRKRLRTLVPLIEKSEQKVVYTTFEDEMGESAEVDIIPGADGFEQFRKKAAFFLQQNLGEEVVARVRSGEQLSSADIDELQRLLVAADIGDDATFEAAAERAGSFGLFIRSIVGLDRAAAKGAFNAFLDDKRYTAQQIQFVNMIIDELTERGAVDAARLYESPFVGVAPTGPSALFTDDEVTELIASINGLTETAGS